MHPLAIHRAHLGGGVVSWLLAAKVIVSVGEVAHAEPLFVPQ